MQLTPYGRQSRLGESAGMLKITLKCWDLPLDTCAAQWDYPGSPPTVNTKIVGTDLDKGALERNLTLCILVRLNSCSSHGLCPSLMTSARQNAAT